jgi:signal transduction histidine kinase
MISADEDGLARLVARLGPDVYGCIEMMSGAAGVREQLARCGWVIEIADARKVKAIAPLACKTDKIDARVLADLARRDLVPTVWVPSLDDRAIRERLRRRAHLIRLRTSAINRTFGVQTQFGLRRGITALRKPGAIDELAEHGMPEVWLQSIRTLLAVIDDLDRQLAPLERELRPSPPPCAVPAEFAHEGLRVGFIVAEALTNIVKHARAESAAVSASVHDGMLQLAVRDDGVGGADPDGRSLAGPNDRVTALRGRLSVHSPAGSGTVLTATLPVSQGTADTA